MSGRSICTLAIAFLLMPVNLAQAGTAASFRYALSNFSGPVASQWAKLAVDQERNEIYALHQRKNDIRVFDEHGMEVFVFGEGFATAADICIGDDGGIFILTTGYQTAAVRRLDYRGEQVSEIPLQKLPSRFSKFVADRIECRRGSLYLVDSDALQVVVTDEDGVFQQGHDLNRSLKPFLPREDEIRRELSSYDWKLKKLADMDIQGFTVDREGNIFFTIPVLFSAFRYSTDGELISFGKSGSGKGKFGVAAGIATDDHGYVYVSDRLRSVVLIFDRNLRFQSEFGYRGDQPSNLIVPDDLVVDGRGNIYVGQARNRGVSVFEIVREDVSSVYTDSAGASDATSRTIGKQSRVVEEVLAVPLEFNVDRGSDTAESDVDDSAWINQESEASHDRGE